MTALRIKPTATTTNIYVKREILIQNIANIDTYLNKSKDSSISTNLYFEIVSIKKAQQSELKQLNQTIKIKEQQSFPFSS